MICMSAFFRLSGVLPIEEAISLLKESIIKTYSYKGEDVVRKNHELLDGEFIRLYSIYEFQHFFSSIVHVPACVYFICSLL